MTLVARYREPQCAGLHAVTHEVLHLLDLVIGRSALLAVVTHDVMAHRSVTDHIADIDAEVMVELVEILRETLPAEFDRAQYLHRDGFDIGEELGQPFLFAAAHRRQRQRAIAEDDGRSTMVAGIGAQRVPGDLGVIVAMVVDKPGRHDPASGVDRPPGGTGQFADLGDLPVLDRDIAAEGRHSGAVDDAAVADQEIIRHREPFPHHVRDLFSTSRRHPRFMKATAGSVFAAWLSSTGWAVAPAGRAGPQSQDRNPGEENRWRKAFVVNPYHGGA